MCVRVMTRAGVHDTLNLRMENVPVAAPHGNQYRKNAHDRGIESTLYVRSIYRFVWLVGARTFQLSFLGSF